VCGGNKLTTRGVGVCQAADRDDPRSLHQRRAVPAHLVRGPHTMNECCAACGGSPRSPRCVGVHRSPRLCCPPLVRCRRCRWDVRCRCCVWRGRCCVCWGCWGCCLWSHCVAPCTPPPPPSSSTSLSSPAVALLLAATQSRPPLKDIAHLPSRGQRVCANTRCWVCRGLPQPCTLGCHQL
jgi:hypothetical protein